MNGLSLLRKRIAAAKVPGGRAGQRLVIATWNVRELGRRRRRARSLAYLAEVLRRFDLVGLVELRDDLRDLEAVLRHLGPSWRALYSDCVLDAGGNRERIAYLYDGRAVAFTGFASTVQAPRTKRGGEYLPRVSWWRPPYAASFRAGRFDFVALTAHVRWGEGERARRGELALLADWVASRAHERFGDRDVVVMGDFNIPSLDSPLLDVLRARGLELARGTAGVHGSDLAQGKRYDQILHLPHTRRAFTDRGGVVDFYAGDHAPLFPRAAMTKRQFTYELSDHLPLWTEPRVA